MGEIYSMNGNKFLKNTVTYVLQTCIWRVSSFTSSSVPDILSKIKCLFKDAVNFLSYIPSVTDKCTVMYHWSHDSGRGKQKYW
jgi:hypothetical protein